MTDVLEEARNLGTPDGLAVLTPRELEVLELIANGQTNAEAARTLQITVHAVKFHLAGIYRRLAVSNRTAAAVVYLQHVNGNAGQTGQDAGN
jgi:DNA-binding CsgD family transcriptional regulator